MSEPPSQFEELFGDLMASIETTSTDESPTLAAGLLSIDVSPTTETTSITTSDCFARSQGLPQGVKGNEHVHDPEPEAILNEAFGFDPTSDQLNTIIREFNTEIQVNFQNASQAEMDDIFAGLGEDEVSQNPPLIGTVPDVMDVCTPEMAVDALQNLTGEPTSQPTVNGGDNSHPQLPSPSNVVPTQSPMGEPTPTTPSYGFMPDERFRQIMEQAIDALGSNQRGEHPSSATQMAGVEISGHSSTMTQTHTVTDTTGPATGITLSVQPPTGVQAHATAGHIPPSGCAGNLGHVKPKIEVPAPDVQVGEFVLSPTVATLGMDYPGADQQEPCVVEKASPQDVHFGSAAAVNGISTPATVEPAGATENNSNQSTEMSGPGSLHYFESANDQVTGFSGRIPNVVGGVHFPQHAKLHHTTPRDVAKNQNNHPAIHLTEIPHTTNRGENAFRHLDGQPILPANHSSAPITGDIGGRRVSNEGAFQSASSPSRGPTPAVERLAVGRLCLGDLLKTFDITKNPIDMSAAHTPEHMAQLKRAIKDWGAFSNRIIQSQHRYLMVDYQQHIRDGNVVAWTDRELVAVVEWFRRCAMAVHHLKKGRTDTVEKFHEFFDVFEILALKDATGKIIGLDLERDYSHLKGVSFQDHADAIRINRTIKEAAQSAIAEGQPPVDVSTLLRPIPELSEQASRLDRRVLRFLHSFTFNYPMPGFQIDWAKLAMTVQPKKSELPVLYQTILYCHRATSTLPSVFYGIREMMESSWLTYEGILRLATDRRGRFEFLHHTEHFIAQLHYVIFNWFTMKITSEVIWMMSTELMTVDLPKLVENQHRVAEYHNSMIPHYRHRNRMVHDILRKYNKLAAELLPLIGLPGMAAPNYIPSTNMTVKPTDSNAAPPPAAVNDRGETRDQLGIGSPATMHLYKVVEELCVQRPGNKQKPPTRPVHHLQPMPTPHATMTAPPAHVVAPAGAEMAPSIQPATVPKRQESAPGRKRKSLASDDTATGTYGLLGHAGDDHVNKRSRAGDLPLSPEVD